MLSIIKTVFKHKLILVCVPLLYFSFTASPSSGQYAHQGRNAQKKKLVRIIANSELVRFHGVCVCVLPHSME
jgi:amino acid transporter